MRGRINMLLFLVICVSTKVSRTVNFSAGHIAYNARDKNTEGDKLGYDHGFGDMWEIEDRAATKTDSWLQIFNFNEGDFILYDLEASMSSDYKSGGTH